jgi:hypothetical protein
VHGSSVRSGETAEQLSLYSGNGEGNVCVTVELDRESFGGNGIARIV